MTTKPDRKHPIYEHLGRHRSPIELVYFGETDESLPDEPNVFVFGEICFGSVRNDVKQDLPSHLLVHVPMSQLGGAPVREYWLSPTPIERHQYANVRFGVNEEILFGYTNFTLPTDGSSFEEQIRSHYMTVLNLLQSQDYPHLFRVWNYLPRIGDPIQGTECYKRFCRARYHAFEAFFEDIIPNLPAASVLGSAGSDYQMVFAASRTTPWHYENPRQVSAYRYPQQYGPKSPLFARATLVGWPNRDILFISGTASIIGHQSQHRGDAQAQAEEVIRNIEALLEHISRAREMTALRLTDIRHLRVYIRDAGDLEPIRQLLERRISPDTQVIYVQANICRPELLVEMEALLGGTKPG